MESVEFFSDLLGHLIELRPFEHPLVQVKMQYRPGNQDKGQHKIVGLAMTARFNRPVVVAVDGGEDPFQLFQAGRPVPGGVVEPAFIAVKQLTEDRTFHTEFEPVRQTRRCRGL